MSASDKEHPLSLSKFVTCFQKPKWLCWFKDLHLFTDIFLFCRDECFDTRAKTANLSSLFPCGDHMVCIIDDREDVWSFAPNLVHVKPYIFFKVSILGVESLLPFHAWLFRGCKNRPILYHLGLNKLLLKFIELLNWNFNRFKHAFIKSILSFISLKIKCSKPKTIQLHGDKL